LKIAWCNYTKKSESVESVNEGTVAQHGIPIVWSIIVCERTKLLEKVLGMCLCGTPPY
jgi:hypothetical protein